MSYSRRLIILSGLIFASCAQAVDVFVDGLYWKATETIEWSLTNNLNASDQQITYNTINFDFSTGFRVGLGTNNNAWNSKIYYTLFYTDANSSVTGNVVSTFLGGKTVQASGGGITFYNAGQVSFRINLNMLDWDLGKTFNPTPAITLRPIVGLRGGWIYQTINSSFQGAVSVNEYVKNNFRGLGPKAALETEWKLYSVANWQYKIVADFTSAYLWGSWDISDRVHDTAGLNLYANVGSRQMGALVLQALVGFNVDYRSFSMKLGYEVSDWFNQYQVLDDGTGARNCDLILQGLTLRLMYKF